MAAIPPFPEGQLEQLATVLGECGTGSSITRALQAKNLEDASGESTKWKRLHWVFSKLQREDHCANQVLSFIQDYLHPSRFMGRSEEYHKHRIELNAVLSFSGIEFGEDGQFRSIPQVRTLAEAEKRLHALRSKLKDRSIPPEVNRYCRSELLQDNFFHAVFEANKGLAQRIRDLSGVDGDGERLINAAFLGPTPVLAFNRLQTESDRSEHNGFAALIKGCFAAIRNPLAHEPKILWQVEEDAADYLTLISLLHSKLDRCVPTGAQP